MDEQLLATLHLRLKGFSGPDTLSQVEGYLEKGKYRVLQYKQNFPNSDTDYVKLYYPDFGGDTWICSRWQETIYAAVEKKTLKPPDRQEYNQQYAVPESRLLELLPEFYDYIYDYDTTRYPFSFRGYQPPLAPPKVNNCCTFVEALLVKAWQNEHESFAWNSELHGKMMILSADDYFSPVTAAVESQMALPVQDHDTPPHPWTIIQGWRNQWRSGHTFLVVDHHQETDRVLTLESNRAYQLDGVGFRQIGNLRDLVGRPPAKWWDRENLWTWGRVMEVYRFRQQARLKVNQRSWSGFN